MVINIIEVLNELEDTDLYDGKLNVSIDGIVYYANRESKLNKFIDKHGMVAITDIEQIVSKEESDQLIKAYTDYRIGKSEKTRDTDGFHFKHKVIKHRNAYREANIPKYYETFKNELESHIQKFPLATHYQYRYETTGYGSEEFGKQLIAHLETNGYIKENGFHLSIGNTPDKINIQIL